MKKVLILAYDFPPYVSVGGLRPNSWYNNLKAFGYEPIVVTRQWENKHGNSLDYISASSSTECIKEYSEKGSILRTPYKPNFSNRLILKYGFEKFKFVRKIYSALLEILQFFVPVGPKKNIYHFANKFLEENNVDFILATGEPFILFNYANKLSQKHNIPWLADYRDPWSQNDSRISFLPFKIFYPYIEKKIVSNASMLFTASPFFKNQLKELFPTKDITVIANGYNSKALENTETPSQENTIFSIAYVGTIYKWHPVESFLTGYESFLQTTSTTKVKLNFYGVNSDYNLEKLIEEKYSSLKDTIVIHPKLENKLLFKELSKNNTLLLFNYYSFIGTKIFDYLAVKRHILLCFSEDKDALKLKTKYYEYDEKYSENNHVQEDVILNTNSGTIVKDSKHLLKTLTKLYSEFEESKQIKCNSDNTEQYSRKYQTKKLATILDSL